MLTTIAEVQAVFGLVEAALDDLEGALSMSKDLGAEVRSEYAFANRKLLLPRRCQQDQLDGVPQQDTSA
jgi:hypothetical protein